MSAPPLEHVCGQHLLWYISTSPLQSCDGGDATAFRIALCPHLHSETAAFEGLLRGESFHSAEGDISSLPMWKKSVLLMRKNTKKDLKRSSLKCPAIKSTSQKFRRPKKKPSTSTPPLKLRQGEGGKTLQHYILAEQRSISK